VRLHPNSCHRECVPHPSTCHILPYSIYLYAQARGLLLLEGFVGSLIPSVMTLLFRSTWHERCDCIPAILAIVNMLYCILQLAIFCRIPFTRTPRRLINSRIQGIMPPAVTVMSRSTRNVYGDCIRIFAIMQLHRILQLSVYVRSPSVLTPRRPGSMGPK
jgi:hypothetical protein